MEQKLQTINETIDQVYLRLDEFPQEILKIFFNQFTLNPDTIKFSNKFRDTLTLYRPLNQKFVRYGDLKDGGYVLINDLNRDDTLLSIGVGENISFDLDCEKQVSKIVLVDHSIPLFEIPNSNYSLYRKRLATYEDSSSITIENLLKNHQSKDYILKMDIEGDEWKILSQLSPDILNRFRQIIIEFHDLNNFGKFDLIITALNNLSGTHLPVVIHPNNIGGYQVIDEYLCPNVLETTWLRRSSYEFEAGIHEEVIKLAAPNNPEKIDLWVSWIYSSKIIKEGETNTH